ncbi:MAG TPA: four helix bundle protein [Candidatus Acidoferrum sp.]
MTKYENRNTKLVKAGVPPAAKVRDFVDLQVWQLARELRQQAYSVCAAFPPDERFALAQQLRRATTSVTANIAEGFGRYSYQENIQFCRLARGSAYEARDHLITAADQQYISAERHQSVESLALRVIQTLNGYIRSTQARQKTATETKG